MSRRTGRWLGRALAAGVSLSLLVPSAAPANLGTHPAGSPPPQYEQRWRVQSEVGGDIGGRSDITVTEGSVDMRAAAGAYTGTIKYADTLVVEDPQGGVMVQVATLDLKLTGTPAGGGAAAGGLFEGTARLDDHLGLTWDQATAGALGRATRSGTYAVAGRWGAYLSGSRADGELLFESAALEEQSGGVDVRDASWFNRFGANRAQRFETTVQGTASSGGTGPGASSGGSALDFIRAGLTGDASVGSLPAVALESAVAAKALRDSKPVGGVALPEGSVSIDLDVSGLLLDAKNRAAEQRPDSPAGLAARERWLQARASIAEGSGESSPTASEESSPTESAGPTQTVLARLLSEQSAVPGARELLAQLPSISEDDTATLELLMERLITVQAVPKPGPSVLAATARAVVDVRDTPVPRSGPAAEALLADADSLSAPRSSLRVDRFERSARDDVPFVKNGKRVIGEYGLVRAVLSTSPLKDGAPELTYSSPRGTASVAPKVWLGYRRKADGLTFWLGGEGGEVALRDAALPGWAFTSSGARLVSSSRVGQTLGILSFGAAVPAY